MSKSQAITEQSEFVDTFGQHKGEGFSGGRGQKIIDLVEPELHADGRYTLYLNADTYAASIRDQYWEFPQGVLDHHDDGDFLSISDHVEAEETALEIAFYANLAIQRSVITAPAQPLGEVIDEEYEDIYGVVAPEFDVKVFGHVEVVSFEELLDYWHENNNRRKN